MSKLTAEQKVCEYNRGQKAAKDGRSRYWSEPSAYPFESDEHYQGRTEAFDQGFDDQSWRELKRDVARGTAYEPPGFPATQLRGSRFEKRRSGERSSP
jgi:hypothetical protein